MPNLAIILRKTAATNLFREVLLQSFKQNALNNLLLCSGFFQEKTTTRTNFFVSQEFLASAPSFPSGKEITTVGLYNGMWLKQYQDFIKGLSNISCSSSGTPLIVKSRKIFKNHWHAKVFIASCKGLPVLGVIGSSNMTGSAFGINYGTFNYEADVVIWDDTNPAAVAVMENAIASLEEQDANSLILADYQADTPKNFNRSVADRLTDLHDEIMSLSVEMPV